jgi:hypothetical protein
MACAMRRNLRANPAAISKCLIVCASRGTIMLMDETLANEVRDLARRLSIVEDVLTSLVEEKDQSTAARPVATQQAAMTAAQAIEQVRAEARTSQPRAVPEWSPAQVAAQAAVRGANSRAERERVLRETVSSVNWLGAISVICFVLAAAFIIKLAVDSGWLTPARQIGLAAVMGIALIGAGLRLMRFDRGYASLLPGAGIIILYLTAVAARSYHHLIGFETALAAVAVISAFTIWLYTVIEHEVYPITAALGAYVTPFLFGADPAQLEFILYYHVACSISFATISIWLESRLLAVIAAYLAIGVTSALSSSASMDPTFIWVMLAHFAIFAFASVIHSVQTRRPMTAKDAWAYFPVLLIFYAGEYALISKLNPSVAPYVSLGFAAVLIALYFAGRAGLQEKSLESIGVVSAYASVVLFHSFYLELLSDAWKPWLFPLIVAAVSLRKPRAQKLSDEEMIPALAIGAIVAIEFFRIVFAIVDGHADANLVAVSFAAPLSLAFLFWQQRKVRSSTELLPVLFMAHGLTILAVYNIARQFGSLAVSGAWLAYSVLIMGFGFTLRDKVAAKSALATLGLAAAKALLYDASMAPAPVRIACLLVTGLVLYGCGFLLKQIEAWSDVSV